MSASKDIYFDWESRHGGAMSWFVYILICADNSYYVGHARDLAQRVSEHNVGQGALHTRLRRPVKLVYSEPCLDQKTAMGRERQIKKWSRAKKQALIHADFKRLHDLARRRS